MKIAIVDDEKSCRDELSALLCGFGAERGVYLEPVPFPGAEAFLSALARERFSLVFMDVFMEGLDGVSAAARLWEADKKCLLVFLTSSGEFRQDALSLHAFDYITKPVTPERVAGLLEDALAVLPPAERYIYVSSERRRVPVSLESIVSVVTDAHYVDITLTEGPAVRSRMTIQEFLDLTDGDPRFLTVNKGVVLNAGFAVRFEENCCVMENGARLPVRVRDRARVEQAVRDYHVNQIRSRQRRGQ